MALLSIGRGHRLAKLSLLVASGGLSFACTGSIGSAARGSGELENDGSVPASGGQDGKPDGTGGSTGDKGGAASSSAGSGGAGGIRNASAGGTRASGGTTSSGGGVSNAGSTGAGGKPPVVVKQVLACDQIANAPVGKWEQLSTDPSMKVFVDVALDPSKSGTVYTGGGAGTDSSGGPGKGLWKSTDCGATWTHISTGRNGDKLNSGLQWRIMVDPDWQVIYADSGYGAGGFYKSSNGGVDWDIITPHTDGTPNFVQEFSLDPTDRRHILVTYHDNCTGALAPQCFAESMDAGATWRYFKGPSAGWEEGAVTVVLGKTTFLYGTLGGVQYSNDSGATWSAVNTNQTPVLTTPGGTSFFRNNNLLLSTTNGTDWNTAFMGFSGNVYSTTNAKDWAKLPGSPRAWVISNDGKYLYATGGAQDYTGRPLWRAPLNDLGNWTNMDIQWSVGPGGMGYDADHHILYAAAYNAGLWRMRTE